MSLRARLLVGLLAIAAAGLIVAGAVTYAAERSFLIDQVDQSLLSAAPTLEDEVDVGAGLRRHLPEDAGANPGRVPSRAANGPGPAPQQIAPIPLGAYGAHLDDDGAVVGTPLLASRGELPVPKLPRSYYVNARALTGAHVRLFTTDSTRGSAVRYRVLVKASDTGSGRTVVALALNSVQATLTRVRTIELIVIASVLVVLAALATALIRLGLRPLERIADTAGAIAAGDLAQRVAPANPRTEVGRLGQALNAMLAQIERAFAAREASEDRLRQFLSDAAHELRTPLASIRGYAELFRMGAAASPAEVAKAMSRIEDESTRMGTLVEDLLTLARLDELPSAPHAATDLAALARDGVNDARVIEPARSITLVAPSPAVVSGDEAQLRQVIANLLHNALRHTPAASPIEVSVSAGSDHVRLEVRDHGPGLPDGVAPDSIFERFWRSQGGRERGRAGAGLGLSIVASIARAHHGRASAESAPGGGARFVVELPAAVRPPGG